MPTLNIEPNIGPADEFYQTLLDAHDGLTAEGSQHLNARLILLLANHIGDIDVLRDALRRARTSPGGTAAGTDVQPPDPGPDEGNR
jgi:hypothetical protein